MEIIFVFQIDTRKIEENSLFVAIKGERFDANTFAKEALDKGYYPEDGFAA